MPAYATHLNWIDTQHPIFLSRVREWVSTNTYSWNVPGLKHLLKLVEGAFEPLGGEARPVPLPSQKVLGSDGSFRLHSLASALVISKRSQAPIQVILGGHLDTVYPPTSPFQSFTISSEDKWMGPGVADMKGGIAILLTALEALERSPYAGAIGWTVILNPDEEIGSPGSAFLFEEAARSAACGLIFEPSFPDGAFVSERKGSANFTVAIKGRAAHAGRDYAEGRSAVFPLGTFIHKMASMRTYPDLCINVTDLEGKGPVNIIPPFASCRVNVRSSKTETMQEAVQRLHHFAKESEEEGVSIEMVQDSFRLPKPFDVGTASLFEAYANCAAELNIPFQLRPSGGVCDGNILSGAGLPTLDTAGAVGGALHTAEEFILSSSLVERARLAALFLFKLAAGEIKITKKRFY